MPDFSWFVVIDGRQQGPMSSTAIQNLYNNGKIDADTLLCRDGRNEWQPFNAVEQFSTTLQDKHNNDEQMRIPSVVDPDILNKEAREQFIRLIVCLASFVFVSLSIVLLFPINNLTRFIIVFVFQPGSIMLVFGLCIGPVIAIFDAMYLGMVPMLSNVFQNNDKDAEEESTLFKLLMNSISLNAVSAGCIGVFISLLGLIQVINEKVDSPKLWCLVGFVMLVYGLFISLSALLLLRFHRNRIKVKQITSRLFQTGELAVLFPTIFIVCVILLRLFIRV